jgi:hypothetical protein
VHVARRVVWLAWYNLQLILVVYPIEALWRLSALCDHRTWSLQRRVKTLLEGDLKYAGGRFAVLAMFSEGRLSPYTLSAIDTLNRLRVNVVIVSNTALTESMREQLRSRCRCLVVRDNVGRDFGAYKDGIQIARSLERSLERLILLNDSVIYLPHEIDGLFTKFLGDEEYIGLTEVHDRHHHVQSFLMSFGPSVLRDPRFCVYWRRYIPIGTRRWSIHKGEVGLTRAMLAAGYRPSLVASLGRLKAALESDRENGDTLALLPDRFVPAGRASADPVAYILSLFREKNQIHVGAFLLTRYAISPLFKRDIVSRGVYSRERLESISGILGIDFPELLRRQEIHPPRRHLSWIDRILFRFGSI